MRHNHRRTGRIAHAVPDTDGEIRGPTKVSFDHMYLHERPDAFQEGAHNLQHLVTVGHKYGRVWAYRVPSKGASAEAAWLPNSIIKDWGNNGTEDAKIQRKADQEPSIVRFQPAMQNSRQARVIQANIPLGESECNGRAENASKRVQEILRVLRHQIGQRTKQKLDDVSPVMAWTVRWAAEIIPTYAKGSDGLTPYERIRQEPCVIPLVPFGETVMYLPAKTARGNNGDSAKKICLWFGTTERTEEALIGT